MGALRDLCLKMISARCHSFLSLPATTEYSNLLRGMITSFMALPANRATFETEMPDEHTDFDSYLQQLNTDRFWG